MVSKENRKAAAQPSTTQGTAKTGELYAGEVYRDALNIWVTQIRATWPQPVYEYILAQMYTALEASKSKHNIA